MAEPGTTNPDITGLLGAARAGDAQALDRLFPLVYEQLLVLARSQRHRWSGDHTLNTVAIAHEAYLKLAGQAALPAADRGHFFAVAATAMRQVLCNYARDRRRVKRGAGAPHVELAEVADELAIPMTEEHATELAALDDALKKLESISERQSRIVECRFFMEMSIEETAEALDISPATVKRDWVMASAWLYCELAATG
jgi:RNA polymerase sigma factor (TIGR02999 family)